MTDGSTKVQSPGQRPDLTWGTQEERGPGTRKWEEMPFFGNSNLLHLDFQSKLKGLRVS